MPGPLITDSRTGRSLRFTAARAQQIGANYAAAPYYDCGEICAGAFDEDYRSGEHVLVSYPGAHDMDPHGLSGSGIWNSRSSGLVWSTQLRLTGRF